MNDLLSELSEAPHPQSSRGGGIEMGGRNPPSSGELNLQNFSKKVQEIEKQYDKLDNLLKKLQGAHEESKAVTKAADMKWVGISVNLVEIGKSGLKLVSYHHVSWSRLVLFYGKMGILSKL